MYVSADDGISGSRARLLSKTMPSSGPQCELNFYYHMYGQDIGVLQVGTGACSLVACVAIKLLINQLVKPPSNLHRCTQVSKLIRGYDNIMFSLTGSQANEWRQAIVRIGRNEAPFQIDIAAVRSYDILGMRVNINTFVKRLNSKTF